MQKLCTIRAFGWLVSLMFLTTSLYAQVKTRHLPSGGAASLNQFGAFGAQSAIAVLELASVDAARLIAEDQRPQKNGRPPRVAVRQDASVDIVRAGTVSERNGYRVYQFEVRSPGAGGLSAKFDRLQLAEGARLFLYNAAQTNLIGPITNQQNGTGNFSTGHVTGDRLIIELQEPIGVAGQSQLHLVSVSNFYDLRGPFGGLRPAGACENNQACFPAYQPEAEGVALILVDAGAAGLFLCTGATVNDARQSFRSFFLTAFHCIDFDFDHVIDANESSSTPDWMFYFKYQSPDCVTNTDDNVYVTISGATYRAGGAASDFTLLELNAQAPQSENISFLGWDRSSALSSTVFGTHHPNGSLKKISFGGPTTTVGVNYASGGGYNVVSGTSFLQLSWNDGVTEGGSSGSPLFDLTSRRVVGQLLGGSSFCTPASAQTAPDQYGRLFTSWTGGGFSSTRLSDWLDPTGISGNTTDLAVPTVSGPTAFTNTGSFALNTLNASITSWSIVGANGAVFSAASGSGNVANLTSVGNASNVVIKFTVNAGQSYAIEFTKTFNVTTIAPPANTPPSPPAGGIPNQVATVSTLFSYTVPAFTDPDAGQTLTYSVQGLPANGLSFNAGTRVVSGTPSATGTVGVTVNANDGNGGAAFFSFTITVNSAPVVVAPMALTLTANPTTLLTTGTTTLSATVSGGTAPYSYVFSGPGIIAQSPANNTASVSGLSAGVQTFTLIVTGIMSSDAAAAMSQTTISAVVSVTVSEPVAGPFGITGVTTVSCLTLSPGQRQISFSPQYAGLNGQPISFSVVNEMLPTTAPGPYTLNPYIDNPVFTLKATQTGSAGEASFTYNWLAACNGVSPPVNQAPVVANTIPAQSGTVGAGFSFTIPANTFSDPNGDALTVSVAGLPGGLSFAGGTISGTPSASGVSTITVKATDPGSLSVSTSFQLTINPAGVVVAGPFSITGVTTVSCTTVTAGLRTLVFNPRYAGLSGQPISFSVANEMLPTTATGPYTLNMYTDNPVITLKATQTGTAGEASFVYNWLAACSGGARIGAVESASRLSVSVLGNPVAGETVQVEVRGAEGQPLRVSLTNVQGYQVSENLIEQAAVIERVGLKLSRSVGVYLLQVSSPSQTSVVRVLKIE